MLKWKKYMFSCGGRGFELETSWRVLCICFPALVVLY